MSSKCNIQPLIQSHNNTINQDNNLKQLEIMLSNKNIDCYTLINILDSRFFIKYNDSIINKIVEISNSLSLDFNAGIRDGKADTCSTMKKYLSAFLVSKYFTSSIRREDTLLSLLNSDSSFNKTDYAILLKVQLSQMPFENKMNFFIKNLNAKEIKFSISNYIINSTKTQKELSEFYKQGLLSSRIAKSPEYFYILNQIIQEIVNQRFCPQNIIQIIENEFSILNSANNQNEWSKSALESILQLKNLSQLPTLEK